MNGNKLFKHYLEDSQKYHANRPEFDYRLNRWKFNTYLRNPCAIVPRNMFMGWSLRGSLVYLIYYYLIKQKPLVKHWNRQGYQYEKEHKGEPQVKW